MPTRTWRGTISDNPTVAGNWAENAVPIAGDDVVFDSVSSNPCTLVGTFPSTGQFRSLIMTGYTGTLNFGDFRIHVGQGNLTGVIFNAGTTANFTCGAGGLQLLSTSTTTTGVNVIHCNNINLRHVNFFLNANGLTRYFDPQSDWYAKNIEVLSSASNSIMLSARAVTVFVYGNLLSTGGYNTGAYDISLQTNLLTLRGNGVINLNNGLTSTTRITFEGVYTLQHNLLLSFAATTGANTGLHYNGGSIGCGDFDVIMQLTGGGAAPHVLNINQPICNIVVLSIGTGYTTPTHLIVQQTLVVNRKFLYYDRILSRGVFFQLRSPTPGTQVDIVLGNDCKYLIVNTNLRDIRFNKPVRTFYCTLTNCTNVTNSEFPQVYTNIS